MLPTPLSHHTVFFSLKGFTSLNFPRQGPVMPLEFCTQLFGLGWEAEGELFGLGFYAYPEQATCENHEKPALPLAFPWHSQWRCHPSQPNRHQGQPACRQRSLSRTHDFLFVITPKKHCLHRSPWFQPPSLRFPSPSAYTPVCLQSGLSKMLGRSGTSHEQRGTNIQAAIVHRLCVLGRHRTLCLHAWIPAPVSQLGACFLGF